MLLIKYAFNKRVEKEFGIEPDELLKNLRLFASEIGDYNNDKQLPRNAVWLTRLNIIFDKNGGVRLMIRLVR